MISVVNSLSSTLWTILFSYCVVMLSQSAVIATGLATYAILPPRFRVTTITTVSFILSGFLICLYYLITENNLEECSIARKIAYIFFYAGFFLYDYYQMLKILGLCNCGKKLQYLLYGLMALRATSYIFNIVTVTAKVVKLGTNPDLGPCSSSFSTFGIYQEHCIAIVFELCLSAILINYILKTRSIHDKYSDFVKKVIDFEIISFAIYMFVEIGYLVIYTLVDKAYLSLLQTWYLNVPVLLMFVNICMFYKTRKINSRSGGTNLSSSANNSKKETKSVTYTGSKNYS